MSDLITTTLVWHKLDLMPLCDEFLVLLLIEEPTPNKEVQEKMGLHPPPTIKYVISAIYEEKTKRFMSFGRDVTSKTKLWTIPQSPESLTRI